MSYDHDCLHCRLARTLREWSQERVAADDPPSADEIGTKVGEFLADVSLDMASHAREHGDPGMVTEYNEAVKDGQEYRVRLFAEAGDTPASTGTAH